MNLDRLTEDQCWRRLLQRTSCMSVSTNINHADSERWCVMIWHEGIPKRFVGASRLDSLRKAEKGTRS